MKRRRFLAASLAAAVAPLIPRWFLMPEPVSVPITVIIDTPRSPKVFERKIQHLQNSIEADVAKWYREAVSKGLLNPLEGGRVLVHPTPDNYKIRANEIGNLGTVTIT